MPSIPPPANFSRFVPAFDHCDSPFIVRARIADGAQLRRWCRFGAEVIVSSIETRASWVVACVALLAMGCSFGAPWIAVVALKAIAADLGGARSTPALAGSLSWFGVGFGGILMSRVADRYGVRWTVMFGAVMICVGLAISSLGASWQLYVGHGLFIGFLGNGGINAPLYVYVSRWFDRRRGSALALGR
jgi:MFS family permease